MNEILRTHENTKSERKKKKNIYMNQLNLYSVMGSSLRAVSMMRGKNKNKNKNTSDNVQTDPPFSISI
jgi:hypothetical protein